ncbi:hypothetical protein C8R45DRAFT_989884 [Mycena sanguinolenta]|nr:hypothetical protein C8R45DRAFT_989884 [Mycena sanguinolenta]
MFFLRIRFFGFFLLLFQCQQVLALTFEHIVGPYVQGAQIPVEWSLNGSEPANGWELWFNEGGSSVKLSDIPPLAISTVVTFPGSNGAFQGLSGTTVLATSNEVGLVATGVTTATTTFSASVVSGSSSTTLDNTSATPIVSHSSAAESVAVSKTSAFTTEALLGIVVGTLVVIAVIVLASVSLFVYRRRRIAAVTNLYPTENADVEKQLALKITPFNTDALGVSPPPRGSSLPQPPSLPPPAKPPPSDLRRQAYLNSQLQKLEVPPPNRSDPESGSIVFGPLSSVPSESMPQSVERDGESTSPPLPPLPVEAGSRRAAFLSEQLQRLEVAERRPSDGSVVFGPLSSVPSEGTARPYAPSDAATSPIRFIRQASSQVTSPVSPPAMRPPW